MRRAPWLPSLQARSADAMPLGCMACFVCCKKYTINFGAQRGCAFIIHAFARCFVFRLCICHYLPTFLPSYLLTFLPSYLPTFLPSYLPTFLPTFLLISEIINNNIINKYLLYRLCARICAHARVRGTRQSKAQKKSGQKAAL